MKKKRKKWHVAITQKLNLMETNGCYFLTTFCPPYGVRVTLTLTLKGRTMYIHFLHCTVYIVQCTLHDKHPAMHYENLNEKFYVMYNILQIRLIHLLRFLSWYVSKAHNSILIRGVLLTIRGVLLTIWTCRVHYSYHVICRTWC